MSVEIKRRRAVSELYRNTENGDFEGKREDPEGADSEVNEQQNKKTRPRSTGNNMVHSLIDKFETVTRKVKKELEAEKTLPKKTEGYGTYSRRKAYGTSLAATNRRSALQETGPAKKDHVTLRHQPFSGTKHASLPYTARKPSLRKSSSIGSLQKQNVERKSLLEESENLEVGPEKRKSSLRRHGSRTKLSHSTETIKRQNAIRKPSTNRPNLTLEKADSIRRKIKEDLCKTAEEAGMSLSFETLDASPKKRPIPSPRKSKQYENVQPKERSNDDHEDPLKPLLSHLHSKLQLLSFENKETQTPIDRSTQTPEEFKFFMFEEPPPLPARKTARPLPPTPPPHLPDSPKETIQTSNVDKEDGLQEQPLEEWEPYYDEVEQTVTYEDVSDENVDEKPKDDGEDQDPPKHEKIVIQIDGDDITNWLKRERQRLPSQSSTPSPTLTKGSTIYSLICQENEEPETVNIRTYENVERTVNDRGIRTVTYFDAQQNPVISIPETNNAGPPSPNTQNKKTEYVIKEIIDSEKAYVKSLGIVVEHYIPVVMNANIASNLSGKTGEIFGNIEKIRDSHEKFLRELESADKRPDCIGKVFLDNKDIFALYTEYCKNKQKSSDFLEAYKKTLAETFEEVRNNLNDQLDLNSYLLKPIQRFPHYRLLLEQMRKQLNGQKVKEIEEAWKMIKTGLRRANGLMNIDAIKNCDINLREEGEFLRKGVFTITKPKKCEEVLFLFKNILVFTVASSTNQQKEPHFIYKDSIRLDEMGISVLDNEELSFDLRKFGKLKNQAKPIVYSLEAKTKQQKSEWTSELAGLLWEQLIKVKENVTKSNQVEGKRVLYDTTTKNDCECMTNGTMPRTSRRKSQWYTCMKCGALNAEDIKKT